MTSQVPPLPPHVVAFLRAHVSSLLQLESLLLIFESGGLPRSARDVGAEMYLSEATVDGWLAGYVDLGFCQRAEGGGYCVPDDPEVRQLLADVADTYVRRKVSVGRVVFGAPVENPKITLAEAFRLRRDDRKDR